MHIYYQQRLVPFSLIKLVYQSVSRATVYTTVSGALKETMQLMLGTVVNSSNVLPNVLPRQFDTEQSFVPSHRAIIVIVQ